MIRIPVTYDELNKIKKGETFRVTKFIEDFVNSGCYCCKVVDDEKNYNNNNDISSALRTCLSSENNKHLKEQVKVFMLNGEVYLKRK